jgi:hypothetical protein
MSALVREVIDAAFEPLLARLQTIDPNAAPRARLQTATRMYKDFALANPREYHTMFMVPDRGRGLLRGSRISVGKQTFAILRGIVADCIEAGEIRGETPDSGALVIWGFVHGLVALQIAGRIGLDRDAFEVFFDRAYAVLFRGFGR